ncbi:MAG: hypothetical protein WD049_03060 [Candidatus Paceibacterota bacterium]
MQDIENDTGSSLACDPPIELSSIAESVAQVIEMVAVGCIVLGAILATLFFSLG